MRIKSKNLKGIVLVTGVITVFFILFTFVIATMPKRDIVVEEVNAKEYVYFDEIAVKVNNIKVKVENGKKFLVADVNGKKVAKQQDNNIYLDDVELYIGSMRLQNSVEDYKIGGKKFWNSEESMEINENVLVELYYPIDDNIEKLFMEGEIPKIIYPEKNYLREINLKSDKEKVYRKIGIY